MAPLSDFVYYPSNNKDTKTYQFKIRPSRIDNMHTFLGTGILFNTDISGDYDNQVLDGYLMVFTLKQCKMV